MVDLGVGAQDRAEQLGELGFAGGAREADAVLAVLDAVPSWWECRAHEAGVEGWIDWRDALPAPPVPVEQVRPAPEGFEPGPAYARALSKATRASKGRHYTPNVLAETMWRETRRAYPKRPRVIEDPAAGGGALLVPALRDAVTAAQREIDDPGTALKMAASSVWGVDTDPVGAWIGSVVLAAELLPLWVQLSEDRRARLPALVEVGDGLSLPAGEGPEAILLNPPYGRVRLDPTSRERWSDSLWGHANLYSLFVHAALERVAQGGVVAALVPTGWLGGAYYRRLRELAIELAPLSRVTFVADRADVFGSVLQETCVAVFRSSRRSTLVSCSRLSVNGKVSHEPVGRVTVRRDRAGLSWPLPREVGDAELVRSAAAMPRRLRDYGWRVSTGPLVWNRHKASIHERCGKRRVPIVWASDLDTGEVQADRARDHLRWLDIDDDSEHLILDEPAVLVQRTTAPEQPRRLIVARLDPQSLQEWGGRVVVENHVNIIRQNHTRPLTPGLLTRLLRTPTLDRLYRCLSGTVAVSAFELEALPLPEPSVLAGWGKAGQAELNRRVASQYGAHHAGPPIA